MIGEHPWETETHMTAFWTFWAMLQKLASQPWSIVDDKKNRWDQFKSHIVNMTKRAGHSKNEIGQALPGPTAHREEEPEQHAMAS